MHKAILLLRKIPKGKVVTYSELARVCRSSPRAIGQIMKRNKRPELYPCYKVVKASGEIGGYAGCVKGRNIQKKIRLLEKDGIKIVKERIDRKYFHMF